MARDRLLLLSLGLLLLGRNAVTAHVKLSSPRVLRGFKDATAASVNASQVHPRRQRRLTAPSVGTFRMLVLLVRFSDHETKELPPLDHFQTLCDSQIKVFFAEQSYGQYNMECDVKDWATTDNTEAHYAAGVSGWQGPDLGAGFFIPILNQLDASGSMDWPSYDTDMDGDLDAVLVIHSGFASEQGAGADCGAADPINRIYSQGHAASSAWTSASFSTYLSGYAVASAFNRLCPGKWASYGIMSHELIHTFGAPDLYNLGAGGGSLGGLAFYDIMSNAWGPNGDGVAASLSSYVKQTVGWLTPTEITADGTYTINLLLNTAEAYIIRQGYALNEYLLIENRGNANRDTGLPGAGLLIYHVDEAVPLQDTPGFPGQDGWPSNGVHFRVALLQADGKYDLEQFVNNGDAGDFWVSGMTLGPGNGQTYPNTDSYQGGAIVSTGITITDISAAGDTMTFRVAGLGGSTTTEVTSPTTPSPTPATSVGSVVIGGDTMPPGTAPPTSPVGGSVVLPSPETSPPISSGIVSTISPAPADPATSVGTSPPPSTGPPSTPPPGTGPPSTPPPSTGPPSTPPPGTGPPSTPPPSSGPPSTSPPTAGGTGNDTMTNAPSSTGSVVVDSNSTMAPTDTLANETNIETNETEVMDVNATADLQVNETSPIGPSDVQGKAASAAVAPMSVFWTMASIMLLIISL